MRRFLSLAICAGLAACAHTNERWGDDEYAANAPARKEKEPLKPESSGPPVSFVVASSEEGEGVGDAIDKVRVDAEESKPAESAANDAEAGIPVVARKGKEIPVIVEKAPADKIRISDPTPAPKVADAETTARPKKDIPVIVEKPAAEQPSVDPFKKLDRDLEKIEGRSAEPEPASPPPTTVASAEAEDAPVEAPPPPKKKKSTRDPNWMGLSVQLGAGVLASHSVIPDYGYHLAYGGQFTWNPAFAGDFALDLGFWRSGLSSTSGFSSVDRASNYASVRILFLPRIVAGFYLGGGVGGIGTYTQVHYKLGTSLPTEVDASAFGFGGDATVALGYRFWHLDARIDLRTLLLQGNRLEFLPTASIGATF